MPVLDQTMQGKIFRVKKNKQNKKKLKGRSHFSLPILKYVQLFNYHLIFCFCLPNLNFFFFIFYSYTGPVDHITEALGSLTTCSASGSQGPSGAALPNRRKPDPLTGLAIQCKPIDRKQELCQRHIQQIFIRGEQVALVAVLPV